MGAETGLSSKALPYMFQCWTVSISLQGYKKRLEIQCNSGAFLSQCMSSI